ncbi:shikimate dehydrogenase [Devosia enhydra]|uniref:Shikimate dehydrogenase n=1 Tax=Devosia enhydra TaxID=665118 RepID=A0A1K2HY51_9HYPH|nr:shikimate dehydrogenase [Devosia enhydra]SFZ84716.1 shikimate dehydrogenase [Devosia enhydra]
MDARLAERLKQHLATHSGAEGPARFRVGLVGRGIQASRTPGMHEREGARLGLSYEYRLIDFDALGLADDDLADAVMLIEAAGFAGINVTHPFKQAIIAELDALAPEAAGIGAVNTVVFSEQGRVGHNTDCWGFAESFREGLPGAPIGTVIQFGAGGGGAAVAHALLLSGVGRLLLCDPDRERTEALAQRLAQRFGPVVAAVSDVRLALRQADGIVNATPMGMAKYPGMAVPPEALEARHWVADIVYFPEETALLAHARSLGCRVVPGTGMAIYQAVKAFELFTGQAPDRASMHEHFRAAA